MVVENELYKMIFERDDSKILELLYERYESLLFNLAYKITQDAQSSEEVLQDVFMKIWNKKAIFNTGKGKLSTWLITLCRNKAIDIIRKKKIKGFPFNENFRGIRSESLPKSDLLNKEVSAEINKVISYLNKDQQKIIDLFYYQGLSQQRIANNLNTPLGTVKSQIRLSVQHLNNYLKKASRKESED